MTVRMQRTRMDALTSFLLMAGALTLLIMMAAATLLPPVAQAAAPDPKITYADLQTRLNAASGHRLDAYFLTVLDGSDIATVTAEIIGYSPGGGWRDSLIYFRATDARVAGSGGTAGIAEGMSGSPLYLLDTDELVGAVAYGDAMTPSGEGLATPIEAMERAETYYAADTPLGLKSAAFTASKVVQDVIITDHPEDFALQAASGTFVARPLRGALLVGGLRKDSGASWRRMKGLLDKHNVSWRLVSASSGAPSGAASPVSSIGGPSTEATSALNPPFVPGASVFALDSVGTLWTGALGTLTYTSPRSGAGGSANALLFGHSYAYPGNPLDLYMSGGWIQGVWPSQYTSYKLGEPTAIVGTVTQDSLDAVLGRVGLATPETKVTATMTNTKNGEVQTGTTFLHQSAFFDGDEWYGSDAIDLVAAALATPADRLFNYAETGGTAETVSTIVVNDGKKDYTITLKNSWSAYDIAWYVTADIEDALYRLMRVNEWGIEKPRIKSVDLTAKITPTHVTSEIVEVSAPDGLKHGNNRIRIKLFTYGKKDLTSVYATLKIPKSVDLNNRDLCLSAEAYDPYDSYYDALPAPATPALTTTPSRTNTKPKREHKGEMAKSGVSASIVPQSVEDPRDEPWSYTTIESLVDAIKKDFKPNEDLRIDVFLDDDDFTVAKTSTTAPNEIYGWDYVYGTEMTVNLSPRTPSYNGRLTITGTVSGPLGTDLFVYGTPAGTSKEVLLAKGRVSSEDDLNAGNGYYYYDDDYDDEDYLSGVLYRISVPKLKENTKIRVTTAATTNYLSCTSSKYSVKVKAKVSLKLGKTSVAGGKKVKLTASVTGVKLKGRKIVFEHKVGKKWKKIKVLKLGSNATTIKKALNWKVPRGSGKTQLRVRFLGGTYNYKSTSSVRTLRVR